MNKDIIKSTIQDALPEASLEFIGDDCNLQLLVISDAFEGMPMIKRHRTILDLLSDSFKSGELHALSLKTKTKMAKEIGMNVEDHFLETTVTEKELLDMIHQLNKNEDIRNKHACLDILQIPSDSPMSQMESWLAAFTPIYFLKGRSQTYKV